MHPKPLNGKGQWKQEGVEDPRPHPVAAFQSSERGIWLILRPLTVSTHQQQWPRCCNANYSRLVLVTSPRPALPGTVDTEQCLLTHSSPPAWSTHILNALESLRNTTLSFLAVLCRRNQDWGWENPVFILSRCGKVSRWCLHLSV